jgi:hypothetical protein
MRLRDEEEEARPSLDVRLRDEEEEARPSLDVVEHAGMNEAHYMIDEDVPHLPSCLGVVAVHSSKDGDTAPAKFTSRASSAWKSLRASYAAARASSSAVEVVTRLRAGLDSIGSRRASSETSLLDLESQTPSGDLDLESGAAGVCLAKPERLVSEHSCWQWLLSALLGALLGVCLVLLVVVMAILSFGLTKPSLASLLHRPPPLPHLAHLPPSSALPPPVAVMVGFTSAQTCTETCNYASDGSCDDGGPGSEYLICSRGTD